MNSSSSAGRVAGLDYGTVRIGIAVSNANRSIASPYENYTRRGDQADAARLCRLVEEEQIVQFVVGLPVHMSGDESGKSQEARAFGRWLHAVTGIPVDWCDERYTTRQADNVLEEAQTTAKRRKRRRDMIAAQIMLAAYLESGPCETDTLPELD